MFLSYAWGAADAATGRRPLQQRAHGIAALLRESGFSVWLDVERMPESAAGGGGGTPEAMAKGILGARAVVCCVSALQRSTPQIHVHK